MQPENSTTRTILLNGHKIAKLDNDHMKTEPSLEDTISQSEPQVQNTDGGPSLQDEPFAATPPGAKQQQPDSSEPPHLNKK